MKVLVADDDDVFRMIMKSHLHKMGYEVFEFDSGRGVADLLSKERIAVCILDIIMDKQEGLETIMELRRLPEHPKIIAVSSNETYLDYAKELGADATMTKPVTYQSLESVLKMIGF
jgi:DNA-binding response OmpR family regulator